MDPCLCRVSLNLDALRHNVALLKSFGKPLMPVIKADAYGHGLLDVAAVLRAEGANRLAVGTVAEAALLRAGGFEGDIIALLGAVWDEDVAALGPQRIIPLVHNWEGLRRLAGAGTPLTVAIKCDTGMARLGFAPEEIPAVADFLRDTPGLTPAYFLSHLAVADVPEQEAFTREQARRFQGVCELMRAAFPGIVISLANSACLMAFPDLAGDLARPGIALYGGNPFFGTPREDLGAGLRPVMEVCAPVLSVHPLRAGQSLGYGRTFVAPADMRVAVVGMGYADAYRRNPAASGMCMTLRGRRARLIGRVAMQMTCLDVTGRDDVRPGDAAWLLGGEGDAVHLHELTAWWGTIPHEVTCLLGKNRS